MSESRNEKYLVLVDGYNLYYSVQKYLKNESLSTSCIKKLLWWDMGLLAAEVLEQEFGEKMKLGKIWYFSAKYKGNEERIKASKEIQERYIEYHRKRYGEEVFQDKYGSFRDYYCKKCRRKYQKEKQTDVNLVIRLLDEVFISSDKYRNVVLISADNDYKPALDFVRDKFKKKEEDIKIYRLLPPNRSQKVGYQEAEIDLKHIENACVFRDGTGMGNCSSALLQEICESPAWSKWDPERRL